jgi:hypothetical protein
MKGKPGESARTLLQEASATKDHARPMGTFQRVLLARRRMAANATRGTKVRIGVLPFEPERLKKKALVV